MTTSEDDNFNGSNYLDGATEFNQGFITSGNPSMFLPMEEVPVPGSVRQSRASRFFGRLVTPAKCVGVLMVMVALVALFTMGSNANDDNDLQTRQIDELQYKLEQATKQLSYIAGRVGITPDEIESGTARHFEVQAVSLGTTAPKQSDPVESMNG